MIPFHLAKKSNDLILGPRLSVNFPRVAKAIEVKCPTYALSTKPPPSDLTLVDALITVGAAVIREKFFQ